jgi:hypothetical protein
MPDNEQIVKWLVVAGIIATIVLYRVLGKRSEAKRRAWFDSIASAFGVQAEHVSEFHSRFATEVDGRRCEVAHRYGSRGLGESSNVGWRLIVTIPLNGVSDIYSLVLQPSSDPDDRGVRVRNSGFNPREGWLNDDVRAAIGHFYEVAPRREPLDVAAGNLTYSSAERVDGASLRARVDRLVPVATALERAL